MSKDNNIGARARVHTHKRAAWAAILLNLINVTRMIVCEYFGMCNGQLQLIKESFFAPLKIDICFQVCLQFGLEVVDATDVTFCNDNDTCSFFIQCIFMCHTETHQIPYVGVL